MYCRAKNGATSEAMCPFKPAPKVLETDVNGPPRLLGHNGHAECTTKNHKAGSNKCPSPRDCPGRHLIKLGVQEKLRKSAKRTIHSTLPKVDSCDEKLSKDASPRENARQEKRTQSCIQDVDSEWYKAPTFSRCRRRMDRLAHPLPPNGSTH